MDPPRQGDGPGYARDYKRVIDFADEKKAIEEWFPVRITDEPGMLSIFISAISSSCPLPHALMRNIIRGIIELIRPLFYALTQKHTSHIFVSLSMGRTRPLPLHPSIDKAPRNPVSLSSPCGKGWRKDRGGKCACTKRKGFPIRSFL
jgi:hypothetical protein